jgi:hypothetical protein
MRRALAILKYVPAVLCGLLVVAWVVSLFSESELVVRPAHGHLGIALEYSTMHLWQSNLENRATRFRYYWYRNRAHILARYLGRFSWANEPTTEWGVAVALPFPLILSTFLPLSVGPFTRFRFPLWSYFAWTALIAAELGYYLN